MKIALAQLNPTVGDIRGNAQRLLQTVKDWSARTDLVVFPELYLTGYPPRDLLAEPWLIVPIEQGIK